MSEMSKKKWTVLLITAVLLYAAVTVSVVFVYKHTGITDLQAKILQNVTYAVLLLGTLGGMKLTGEPFSEFGLFWRRLPLQLVIGVAAGAGILLFMRMLGKLPAFPEHFSYLLFSQLLVAASEETFWRGLVLRSAQNVLGAGDKAVFLSALLFSLSHFPLNLNVGQLIFTFVVGALFAVLRIEFGNSVGIPATVVAHTIANVF